MGWFSLGGNVGFALAPVLVAAVVGAGGLGRSPLLVVPAVAGAVLCLVFLRGAQWQQTTRGASGAAVAPAGAGDTASFVRLAVAVVCRSVVFTGPSTFIAFYARERAGGSMAAGAGALFVLYLGGAAGTVLGGRLAERRDRVTVARWSYAAAVVTVAGLVLAAGPAVYLFVALTSAALYVPFSLQVTLAQDYLPSRVGTAGGVTLGLGVGIGGLAGPLIGRLAAATSLQTALAPLVLMPALSWLLFRTLAEPAAPGSPAPAAEQARETAET